MLPKKIKKYNSDFKGFPKTDDAIKALEESSKLLSIQISSLLSADNFSKKLFKNINKQLIAFEKSFISNQGMYFGSWYKSLYASSDPFSGYAAWIIPGVEYEIALRSSDRLEEWDKRYAVAILNLKTKMKNLSQEIQSKLSD
jgi:N-acetylated-alpha-linked acidic dipeptidase